MNKDGKQTIVESIIVDILAQELKDIVNPDNVYIQDQNKKVPNDKDIYIAVRMVDSKVVANVNRFEPTDEGINEIQEIQIRENVQVDIFGKNRQVMYARARMVMALNSLFAEQQQELYNFKIYKIPTTFVNSASVEGGSQYNRFTIVIPTLVWYRKVTEQPTAGYFDKYPTRVDDEDTIGEENGLIEFELN